MFGTAERLRCIERQEADAQEGLVEGSVGSGEADDHLFRQRCVFTPRASADEAQLYDRRGALSEWCCAMMGQTEYQGVRYVFLLLASENARSYLYSLASLARVFQDDSRMERLAAAESLPDFRRELKSVFGGDGVKPRRRHDRFNNLILKEAAKIAKGANCTSVLVFGDTFGGGSRSGANV